MADLKKRLNEILNNLDKNIKNKEDLEYIKSEIYNISMLFLDEIDKIAELNINKMNAIQEKEKALNKKINMMEKDIRNIEKELYITEDCDFSIQCPYCNTEFVEDFTDGYKHEVRCPECDNVIQLEWSQDEECDCNHECDGKCHENCEEEIEDEEENNEDDM